MCKQINCYNPLSALLSAYLTPGDSLARSTPKWFAGGTQVPDFSAMLDPNNLAEMLKELNLVFKKR